MKWLTAFALFLSVRLASAGPIEEIAAARPLHGIDVWEAQGNLNWAAVKAKGNAFVYIQATTGTTYKNSLFGAQHSGATRAGLICGARHFARPDVSSGATQANFFVTNGGNWKADGFTLPGALELTYNPYGPKCYGLSRDAMTDWVHDFSNTYHSMTARYPVIYTNGWWAACMSNTKDFSKTNPVWIANYSSMAGPLPPGYRLASFWQYDIDATDGFGKDYFTGDWVGLKRLVSGP